jgi:hypothetical protein
MVGKAAVQKKHFANDETAGDTRWRAKGMKKAKKRKKQSRGLTAGVSGKGGFGEKKPETEPRQRR